MKQYVAINDIVYFWFAGNNTSGSGEDGASPAADVRLAGAAADAAPVYSPTPVLLSHVNYPAGAYEIAITASVVNGFTTGNTYAVFCTLAIDSQNPTGFVGSFDTKPVESNITQVGDTAQSATDLKDLVDTGYDNITHKIQGVVLTDTVTALTGHTAQTGDNFTRLGAPVGVSIAADLVVIDNFVDNLETRLSAIRAGYLDNLSVGAVALASGVDITHIHGSALTETIDGYLAAAFVKLFNVAIPLLVASDVMVGTDDAALATAVANVQTDLDNPSQYMADISTLATSIALTTHDSKLDVIDTNVDAILEDTSTTLETHLIDIKGTEFIKDINSLPQCLTAVGFSTHDVDAIQTALEADDGKLYAVYAALLNKMTVTSTLMRIYKDDAITLLNELTLSDDDITVTRV